MCRLVGCRHQSRNQRHDRINCLVLPMAALLSSIEATSGRLQGRDDALHLSACFMMISCLFPLAPREASFVSPIKIVQILPLQSLQRVSSCETINGANATVRFNFWRSHCITFMNCSLLSCLPLFLFWWCEGRICYFFCDSRRHPSGLIVKFLSVSSLCIKSLVWCFAFRPGGRLIRGGGGLAPCKCRTKTLWMRPWTCNYSYVRVLHPYL